MIRSVGCEANSQESVANEVLSQTADVAKMAEDIASRLCIKLESVMSNPLPREKEVSGQACREYPPLFSIWRSHILAIQNSLDIIEAAIQRTEL